MLQKLAQAYPRLRFESGKRFMWSPEKQTVYFIPKYLKTRHGLMALLHEVGHSLLDHADYELDVELLDMEVSAWIKARELAQNYHCDFDEDHIDDCLETYRVWLYKRSRCPECQATCLQESKDYYHCFLCQKQWRVASTRTLQPRRMNAH